LAQAGRSPAELSHEFGPSAQTIINGVAQAARDAGNPLPGKEGLTSAERGELARLRRENRQLKMEREIWFCRDKTLGLSEVAAFAAAQ
jgi:transposase